jgi:hypothetical protein
MDLLADFIEGYYLPNKADFSRGMAARTPKRPLPKLGTADNGQVTLGLVDAINEQCTKLPYKMDPMWGLTDYYTHHETVQYEIEYNTRNEPYDCDDLANYAYELAGVAGVYESNRRIWNLIIAPVNQFSQCWANHVISAFKYVNHQGAWWAVIDTNTAYNKTVFWHLGTEEEAKARFIQQFSGIHKVNYYKILAVTPPFK